MFATIRRYLIAGLLLWLPIWVTLIIVRFLIDTSDNLFSLLPTQYQPDSILGFHLPGLGLVVAVVILLITGILVSNFLGRQLVNLWEKILARIPFVRSIYSAVKQVSETVFSSNGQAFRKVLLVKYPHSDMLTIAFLAGDAPKEVSTKFGEAMLAVYVPTTPNPTSGFLVMVKKQEAIELNMSVDEALKYVISLGVVQPGVKKIVENEKHA